ncbi:hypothetical protein BDV96DRAFT_561900 [Lophiotrema nucula]|uniref:Amine oxidase n=1 Tax=Lophiotrema nucula TaxID=690887 RepID=A0A6A5ZVY8_9PLEO|nr:hypothetical protein BDV96DRAFT_561900 [Lophiotrema nucula]
MACWRVPLIALMTTAAARTEIDETLFSPSNTIERDVAVVGGGASGTYAAVQLHDLNKTIVLIERDDHLSGHVNTYQIPGTNTTIEYGVQSYMRYGNAEAFFKRLGVEPGSPYKPRVSTNINVDLSTGKILTGYAPPSMNETNEALKKWLNYTAQYTSFLDPGYWSFPAPDDIPSDLLLPFEVVAKRLGIEAAVPRMMSIGNVGLGGIRDLLTLYVVMAFGYVVDNSTVEGSFFVPKGSNSLVYQRANELLRPDILLSSKVACGERSDSGVKLVVKSADGNQKLIKAKKLLISAPPSLENMKPFGLDEQEEEVYSTWEPTWSFVGVAKIACINENNSVSFLAPSAVPANHLAVRDYPYSLRFDSTGPVGGQLYRVIFGTNYSVSYEEAKSTVQATLQKAIDVGTITWNGSCEPEYRAWADHNNILWKNDATLIKSGFVQKLYALQGRRSTWYTGLTWTAHYSSNVWAYTDTVLPKLLKGL